jgi:hypothetical protein
VSGLKDDDEDEGDIVKKVEWNDEKEGERAMLQ